MNMVIGGAYQEKRKAACLLYGISEDEILDGETCEPEAIFRGCKAVCNFHRYIFRKIQAGEDVSELVEKLYNENPEICIITDEIGYGIVPLDKTERLWREQTGRVCCKLAEKSDTVVRVVCGIPMFIKGKEK